MDTPPKVNRSGCC